MPPGIMVVTDRRDFFDGEPGYGLRYSSSGLCPTCW
jgi:hypothetical protein